MQWTAGQLAAIQARNDSVLVSAAAGSGKTAVLVERVLSLLREGKRIDRMLIVTFTRAAAGEMRERIGRRLDEEGMETVFSEVVPPEGVGLAVMNRLGRAAAFRTIKA